MNPQFIDPNKGSEARIVILIASGLMILFGLYCWASALYDTRKRIWEMWRRIKKRELIERLSKEHPDTFYKDFPHLKNFEKPNAEADDTTKSK